MVDLTASLIIKFIINSIIGLIGGYCMEKKIQQIVAMINAI